MSDHWYAAWGFWVGIGGFLAGVIGIGTGLWMRNHPKCSRLACRIAESGLIQHVHTPKELRVTLGGMLVPDPYVAQFTVTNLGPEDLSPASFEGGYLRFTTPAPVYTDGAGPLLTQTMTNAAILQSTTPVKFDYLQGDRLTVDVEPCQIKVGESASVSVLVAGSPHFTAEARLTSFSTDELRGDKPADYELSIELPFPLAHIPITWRRRSL